MRTRLISTLIGGLTLVGGLGLTAGTASAATTDCTGWQALSSQSVLVTHQDGTSVTYSNLTNSAPSQDVRPGDTIKVTFTVKQDCIGTPIGLASYRTQSAQFNGSEPQSLFSSQTATGTGSSQTLTVTLPVTAADGTGLCPNKHQDGPETKNKGANTSGAYDSTCNGRPSGNGNGDGKATGRPCAGCVGNADDKNPPGQAPDGSDSNKGFECETNGNKGVARENPAHTSCAQSGGYQVDLFTGEVLQVVDSSHLYGARLIGAFNGPKPA